MPMFLAMFTDRNQFSIVFLTVMTRGPSTEGSGLNSGNRRTTHSTGTIVLKMNLKTILNQGGYRSLAQYMFVDNIELRVETSKTNIFSVNFLDPAAVLYPITGTIPDNFST